MKASVYIAASVDGFIARENGDIEWLYGDDSNSKNTETEEDYGYKAFMSSIDALVMGRHTFEKVLTFSAWPYEKPVVVLSSSRADVPRELASSVEIVSLPPPKVMQHCQERGFVHLYIDGGNTIQRFLREDLIAEIIITRIPVLLGSGIPLFGNLIQDVRLRHMETRSFPNGLVQSRYQTIVSNA